MAREFTVITSPAGPDVAQLARGRDTLKADTVELGNLLLRTDPVLKTDLGARLARLSLRPCGESVNDGLTIALELGADAVLWVDLPARSVPILAGVAEGIDFAALPKTLRGAVLEMAVAPLVGPLSELFGERVAIADTDHAVESEGGISLDLRDQGDDTIATLRLGLAAYGLIKTALEGLAPVDGWSGANDVSVQLSAEIAAVAVSLSELSQLRTGDLVLLPAGIDPGAVSIRAGSRIVAAGRYDGGKIRIEQLIGGNGMDDNETDLPESEDEHPNPVFDAQDDSDADAPGEGLDVDQIEVPMCFGLGTVVITVADLRAITEGYTISLPPSEVGEVLITVSGQEVGRGEIVQIDDRLGVRVTKLESARSE